MFIKDAGSQQQDFKTFLLIQLAVPFLTLQCLLTIIHSNTKNANFKTERFPWHSSTQYGQTYPSIPPKTRSALTIFCHLWRTAFLRNSSSMLALSHWTCECGRASTDARAASPPQTSPRLSILPTASVRLISITVLLCYVAETFAYITIVALYNVIQSDIWACLLHGNESWDSCLTKCIWQPSPPHLSQQRMWLVDISHSPLLANHSRKCNWWMNARLTMVTLRNSNTFCN